MNEKKKTIILMRALSMISPQAETFHKHLRTPPSAESKRAAAIRRADGDKGLERVAR